MNHRSNQQPRRINGNVPLSTGYFLAAIIAALRPPFSVVFTDCESTIAADGCLSRPIRSRNSA
jgi:hypothetical protein